MRARDIENLATPKMGTLIGKETDSQCVGGQEMRSKGAALYTSGTEWIYHEVSCYKV